MIYVSKRADAKLLKYLSARDEVCLFGPLPHAGEAVACHADLLCCRLGAGEKAAVFKGEEEKPGESYPADCIYCGVLCGEYFIHNLKNTDSSLLYTVKNTIDDIKLINVRQGYTRCNLAPVDDGHVITSDRGIAKALKNTKIECLLISEKQVLLPGYAFGFIGGTMGRVGNEIIFNGNLSLHSDFAEIRDFVHSCGLNLKYFEDYPLTDIGSIIAG